MIGDTVVILLNVSYILVYVWGKEHMTVLNKLMPTTYHFDNVFGAAFFLLREDLARVHNVEGVYCLLNLGVGGGEMMRGDIGMGKLENL